MPTDPEPPTPSDAAKPPAKPARRKKAGQRAWPVVTKNRMFAALVCGVFAFTLLAFVTAVALAVFGRNPPSPGEQQLAALCDFVIKVGFGAIIGLLGGRAAAPDSFQPGPKDR